MMKKLLTFFMAVIVIFANTTFVMTNENHDDHIHFYEDDNPIDFDFEQNTDSSDTNQQNPFVCFEKNENANNHVSLKYPENALSFSKIITDNVEKPDLLYEQNPDSFLDLNLEEMYDKFDINRDILNDSLIQHDDEVNVIELGDKKIVLIENDSVTIAKTYVNGMLSQMSYQLAGSDVIETVLYSSADCVPTDKFNLNSK